MFEELAKTFSEEMLPLSRGSLHCLPYSRALIEFFELRGKAAIPLVVRCVVLGRPEPAVNWQELDSQQMIKTAIHAPRANAGIVVEFTPENGVALNVTVPYRTLGIPHSEEDGDKTLGNFENGKWLGHLVVIADNTLIDLTIGQLNDETFRINFSPPYVTVEADERFLAGKGPIIGEHDGMLLSYFAFPEERTYEKSDSWTKRTFQADLRATAERVARRFDGAPDTALSIPPAEAPSSLTDPIR